MASRVSPVARSAAGPVSSSERLVRAAGLRSRVASPRCVPVKNGGTARVTPLAAPPRMCTQTNAFAVDREEAEKDNEEKLTLSEESLGMEGGSDMVISSSHEETMNDSNTSSDFHRASPVVRRDASLAEYCTLGVGGPANTVVEVYTTAQLIKTLRQMSDKQVPTVVIGKGSNVLFTDDGFSGCAVVNKAEFVEDVDVDMDAETNDQTNILYEDTMTPSYKYFKVASGTAFNQLGAFVSKSGYSGLEFAVGVPGTAGGAVFMNAGADGQSTADTVCEVEVVSPCGFEVKTLRREDIVNGFGYRQSPFMESASVEDENAADSSPFAGWIITSVTFKLKKDSNAPSVAKECMRRRRETQPLWERSVGCLFRNPGEGVNSAGALIDRAGLKGLKRGNASVSDKHANFLVYREECVVNAAAAGTTNTTTNTATRKESAKASDMIDLIDTVKRTVFETNGIELEEEVRRVPYSKPPAARRQNQNKNPPKGPR